MKEDKIELIEIWTSTNNPSEALAYDFDKQKHLKRIAIIANNIPLFLTEDYVIEKRHPTKQEFNKFNTENGYMNKKIMCAGDDCYNMIDTSDVVIMANGKLHPMSRLCYDCQGDTGRKNLKNYKKARRHKLNKTTSVKLSK